MSLHILHTPMHEHRREAFGVRWCFQCRKRLAHEAVLMVMDDPMSYYGPSWQIECSRCGENHIAFPGTEPIVLEAN